MAALALVEAWSPEVLNRNFKKLDHESCFCFLSSAKQPVQAIVSLLLWNLRTWPLDPSNMHRQIFLITIIRDDNGEGGRRPISPYPSLIFCLCLRSRQNYLRESPSSPRIITGDPQGSPIPDPRIINTFFFVFDFELIILK